MAERAETLFPWAEGSAGPAWTKAAAQDTLLAGGTMSLCLMGGEGKVPHQRVLGVLQMLVSWLWRKCWGWQGSLLAPGLGGCVHAQDGVLGRKMVFWELWPLV